MFLDCLNCNIPSDDVKKTTKSHCYINNYHFVEYHMCNFFVFFNTPFRDSVNVQFNSSDSHRYTIDNNTYYLPLPSKTALKYRISDVSAVYITKSIKEEIIDFYRNVFCDDLIIETGNNRELYLKSNFKGMDIRISIYRYDNLRKMFIEIE